MFLPVLLDKDFCQQPFHLYTSFYISDIVGAYYKLNDIFISRI